ncbi:hypothetical protein SKAU_G00351730 [Synaphobranchus kaupii]|uniref:FADD n=1 Tax=Synaphobranchus kaupii TaxID=118154 RepID=A0A9Q1EKT8_SYNKA|nr:hypothetical protein SKAU_G00351730 [Synaphobranchus kaupii]
MRREFDCTFRNTFTSNLKAKPLFLAPDVADAGFLGGIGLEEVLDFLFEVCEDLQDAGGIRAAGCISSDLSPENVEEIKFLCPDIGKKRLENIKSGIQLFQCLREMEKIGPDNTQFLRYLLNTIKRADLLEILSNFEKYGAGPEQIQLDPNERAKLDIATDVLSEQLGKHWRRFGRKLGITDAKLEHISAKHPNDLREQAVGLSCEWQKMRGAEATVDDLIKALRACDFNLTADLLTRKLWEMEQQH